jgi:hypothetical protein
MLSMFVRVPYPEGVRVVARSYQRFVLVLVIDSIRKLFANPGLFLAITLNNEAQGQRSATLG